MAARAISVVLALLAHGCLGSQMVNSANPVRKVVTLMQEMQKEIASEGAKEQELFDKFMCFCSGGEAEMQKSASDAKAKIDELSAQVTSETAEKSQLEQDLVTHAQEKESATGDLEQAAALRSKEAKQNAAEAADNKANLEALSGAIPALEKGMGADSFVQLPSSDRIRRIVQSSKFSNNYDRKMVVAFLDQSGDYVPQSGQIVGILKSMKDEMEKSLEDGAADEEESVAAFNDLKAAKTKEVAAAAKAIQTKKKRSGALAVSVVQAQDELDDSKAELAKTQKFLGSLEAQCEEKQKEWDARKQGRAEEVKAISEAISMLNDDDALDVFKKAIPSMLVQQTHEFGFLQSHGLRNSKVEKAQALLASAAHVYRSKPLQLLAYAVSTKLRIAQRAMSKGSASAKADFGEITKMIDEMVAILAKEQQDDVKHKEFCGEEFDKSGDELKEAQEEAAAVSSTIEELADEISTLAEDIKTLSDEVTSLDKSVAEATEQRKDEHKEYTETLALTETAVQLIGKAKNRLLKFYNPSQYKAPPQTEATMEEKIVEAGGGMFAQVQEHRLSQPEAPETWGAYEKKDQKSSGVIGLMDMLTKEMTSEMKDTEHNEKTAQKEYSELMSDSQTSRSQDVKSITDKESSKAFLEGKLTEAKESKALTAEKLDDIHGYIQDLHVSCDFIMDNFDLRKEARENEAESLKNAKAVLSGASFR